MSHAVNVEEVRMGQRVWFDSLIARDHLKR